PARAACGILLPCEANARLGDFSQPQRERSDRRLRLRRRLAKRAEEGTRGPCRASICCAASGGDGLEAPDAARTLTRARKRKVPWPSPNAASATPPSPCASPRAP